MPTPAQPTETPIPPTPTPANAPPVITLEDQIVPDDEIFPMLMLDSYVQDPDHSVTEITWSCSGNVELRARLFPTVRRLRVTAPSDDWRGSETLLIEACDPGGACDTAEVVFAVLEENDPPVIALTDQPIFPGEAFSPITLAEHVSDVDHAVEDIAWSYSGNTELAVTITEGVLQVELPDEGWRGGETIQLEACDPGGACDSVEVLFTVLGESDLLITYVHNAGFMISSGDTKILLDAIFRDVPASIRTRLENAEPPFDDVDLVLATHDHFDHFSSSGVGSHLENNPGAFFVSTESAVASLERNYTDYGTIADRVIPIQLEPQTSIQMTVNGIDLEILEISHGIPDYLNLGFIITVGGYKLLHTGDMVPDVVDVAYLEVYDLPAKQLDVAMVPHFILITPEDHPIVLEGIQARYVIPMHLLHTTPPINYVLLKEFFPDAVYFYNPMERWLMPRER
jgi:L-ascorbate metabolism protein UlaG (beta-lactamase superfamily)